MFEVDLGVDWRAHDPVWMDIGPVLAVADAVANKVCALFSRAEPRDFLDVDAIRQTGLFSDADLLRIAAELSTTRDSTWPCSPTNSVPLRG